jgi:hypothetical protein
VGRKKGRGKEEKKKGKQVPQNKPRALKKKKEEEGHP